MSLSISYSNSPLAASSLLVSSAETWDSLIQEMQTLVHRADFWLPSDPEKPLPVAEARALQLFATHTAVGSERVAIIPWADQLALEAANTLLKLLEEPPVGLTLLLLAETDHLLPTIRSRVLLVSSPRSATLNTDTSEKSQWSRRLNSYDLNQTAEREEVKRLLYLYPLLHQGIRSQTVLDSAIPPR